MSGRVDTSIAAYFDEKSWNSMRDYEKLVLSNKKRNYLGLRELGFDPPIPDFMRTVKRPLLLDEDRQSEKSKSQPKDRNSQKKPTATKRLDSPIPDIMRTVKRPLLLDEDRQSEKSKSQPKDRNLQKKPTATKRLDSPMPDIMRTVKRPLLFGEDHQSEKSKSQPKDRNSQKKPTAPKRTEIQKQQRLRSGNVNATSSRYADEPGPKYHLPSKRVLSNLIPRTERHLENLIKLKNLLEKHDLKDVELICETEASESDESEVDDTRIIP